jgi:hypothetical protein
MVEWLEQVRQAIIKVTILYPNKPVSRFYVE